MQEEEKESIYFNKKKISIIESSKKSNMEYPSKDRKEVINKTYESSSNDARKEKLKLIENQQHNSHSLKTKENSISVEKSKTSDLFKLDELSTEELISVLKSKLDSEPIQNIKPIIDEAKKVFYERSNKAYNKELKKFQSINVENNFDKDSDNNPDFEYLYPHTREFKEVLKTYKIARDSFYFDQEKKMKLNLKIKLELIDELKSLLNGEEKIKETFNHFKNIQERWKATGKVPKSELNNLWNNYNHHIENFFDYIKINNDLRDIEFKRNLTQKIELCEITEELDNEVNLNITFATLQSLHDKWKEIGPVGKSNREKIWGRFQTATKILHKKRNDFYEKRKEEYKSNYEQKISLCRKVENIDYSRFNDHNSWQKTSTLLNELRDEWKNIGPVNKSQNNISWKRFISAVKRFNLKKKEYYIELKRNKNVSLKVKIKLVERAESLSQSTNWQITSQELKKLQIDWKNSGIAPRKETNLLWKRFKNASNIFFENLKKQNEILNNKFEENLKAKKTILKKITDFHHTGKPKKDANSIKNFISDWEFIGKVPNKNIKSIESRFRKSINQLYEKLDIDNSEKKDIQFKSKIQLILAENNPSKIKDELFKIQLALKKCKDELSLLENNISFFKYTKQDNPMVVKVIKNIQNEKNKLKDLKSKMAYIKSL